MQMIDIVQNRKWKAAKRVILHDYKMAQYRKGATAMILNEKERAAIMDLQSTGEKLCGKVWKICTAGKGPGAEKSV